MSSLGIFRRHILCTTMSGARQRLCPSTGGPVAPSTRDEIPRAGTVSPATAPRENQGTFGLTRYRCPTIGLPGPSRPGPRRLGGTNSFSVTCPPRPSWLTDRRERCGGGIISRTDRLDTRARRSNSGRIGIYGCGAQGCRVRRQASGPMG